MYVAFSKKQAYYSHLTNQFNRGLALIKSDGTFAKILAKHHIRYENIASLQDAQKTKPSGSAHGFD